MDPLLLPGRSALCWRFSLSIRHPFSHSREDSATQQQVGFNISSNKLKLWLGTPPAEEQSRLSMKTSHTRSSISASASAEMKEQTWTSRAVSTRPETLLTWWAKYGAPCWNSVTAVLTTLLCGSECWRLTEKDKKSYHNFTPRASVGYYASFGLISSQTKTCLNDLELNPMAAILVRRRWRWTSHVTSQAASIAKTALHWTPEGKRRRSRPKVTRRRTVEKEMEEMGKDLEQHSSQGERPADVEWSRCCSTCHPA